MVYGYTKSIYDAIKKQKISARRTRAKVFAREMDATAADELFHETRGKKGVA